MTRKTLLTNGVVVIHGADDEARTIKADVLIEDDRITQITPDTKIENDVKVIDCTDKIIAPGFIDTHRHMYNTVLRGRHGNDVLPDYIVKGILQGGTFDSSEIFWGQLAGCLESINNGTTTVVDHSHLNYAEDRVTAAIQATSASGIRSIYGYCFTGRVDSWSPFALNPDYIAPFALADLQKLATAAPFGNGRVKLGVAFDGWFLPQTMLKPLFQQIKDLGVRYVTTHNAPSPPGIPTSIETMHACGVLSDFTVVLAHANHLAPGDATLVKQSGAFVSSTPSVELQMGMGTPVCFDSELDMQSQSSLGVDCHNVALASIVGEMRSALVYTRGVDNARYLSAGKMSAKVNKTVQEAYALGTIQGARAIGMEAEIGSLAVGKKADILIFDALAPSMICGAQYDPITAIVMHSSPGDIVMTFVDGILRKSEGKILPVPVDAQSAKFVSVDETSTMPWSQISKNLLKSQHSVQAKINRLDPEAAKNDACAAFGFDTSLIVSKL